MEYYLPIQLHQPESVISLPKPLPLSKDMELGVVEYTAPKIQNISVGDFIKVALHRKYISRVVDVKIGEPCQNALNEMFKKHQYHSEIRYEQNHFVANIHRDYLIEIGANLSKDLGLPRVLSGQLHGVLRKAKADTNRREKIQFYSASPKKRVFKIQPGYYESAKAIRDAFREAGLKIHDDGHVERSQIISQKDVYGKDVFFGVRTVIMNRGLRRKLKKDYLIHCLMLYSPLVEPCHVGEDYASLVRILPVTEKAYHFQPVQYKRMRQGNELAHLHFKLCDDSGQLAQFSGSIHLTVHLRNAHRESTLL